MRLNLRPVLDIDRPSKIQIKDQRSKVQDQRSKVQDQSSKVQDQIRFSIDVKKKFGILGKPRLIDEFRVDQIEKIADRCARIVIYQLFKLDDAEPGTVGGKQRLRAAVVLTRNDRQILRHRFGKRDQVCGRIRRNVRQIDRKNDGDLRLAVRERRVDSAESAAAR